MIQHRIDKHQSANISILTRKLSSKVPQQQFDRNTTMMELKQNPIHSGPDAPALRRTGGNSIERDQLMNVSAIMNDQSKY